MREDLVVAAGVLVQETYPGGRYLLIQRQDNLMWSVPGGYLEPEESPRDAACYEFEEETGVPVEGAVLVGYAPTLKGTGLFALYKAKVRKVFDIEPDDNEIADWGWFLPGDLPSPLYPGLETFLED